MSRDLIIAVICSILLHGGVAGSGYLFKEKPAPAAVVEEVPTIALDLPPPPEPDEPEVVEDAVSDAPAELADLAPPMQNDMPSAVIDSPFVQQIQAPPPPGLNRPTGAITIPTNTRPAVTAGKALGNIFDLASLDQRPEARVRITPVYPFEMRRSGLKGEVVVGFIVDSNGDVRDPYIVKSSNPGFEDAAIQAVLKWKFRPGRKGGAAVNTRVAQPLTFNLNTE
jgi:protein TonB